MVEIAKVVVVNKDGKHSMVEMVDIVVDSGNGREYGEDGRCGSY